MLEKVNVNEQEEEKTKKKNPSLIFIIISIGVPLVLGLLGYWMLNRPSNPPAAIVETVVKEEPPAPVVVIEEVTEDGIIQVSKDWMIVSAGLYKLTKGHLCSPYIQYQGFLGEFKDERIILFTEDTIVSSSNGASLVKLDKLPDDSTPVVVITNVEKTSGWVIDDSVVDIPKGVYEVYGTLLTPAGRSISSGSQIVEFLFRTTAARAREGYFVFIRKVDKKPNLVIGTEEVAKVEKVIGESETIVAQADTPAPSAKPEPQPKPSEPTKPKPTHPSEPKPEPSKPTVVDTSYFDTTDGFFYLQIKNPNGKDASNAYTHGYYHQTGVGKSLSYKISVPPGWVCIFGAWKVDGTEGGCYSILGEGSYNKNLTDGFALLIRIGDARSEFQFRLDQAPTKKYVDWGPLGN